MMLGAWNIPGGMMSAGPGMPDGMGGTNPGAPGMPGMGGTSPGAQGMPGMGGTGPGAQGMPGMGGTSPGAPGMPGMGGMTPGGTGVPGGMMPSGMGMMMGYNWFTISGKAFPANAEWTVKEGELVRVRLLDISNLSHPMHLHGHDFKVISKDGEPLPALQQTVMNTITVNPGETYDILVLANNPGLWMFHCHELHHTENDGVEPGGLIQVLRYEGFTQPPVSAGTPLPGAARPQPGTPGMRH